MTKGEKVGVFFFLTRETQMNKIKGMTKEIREENFSEKEMHLCYNSLQEG
jgi:hypothetical protein